jgi:hypothetical protein
MFSRTPKRRAPFFAYILLVVLAQPLVVTWYYQETLHRGWYPVEGDSISLPIFANFLAWSLALPLVGWMLVWLWRRYEPSVSLFVTRSSSRLRSMGYSVLAIAVGLCAGLWFAEGVREALWLVASYALVCFHAALTLRASALGARVV